MHPFFLSQTLYQSFMIVFILSLIFYEKMIKKDKLEKTKISVNFMTAITLLGLIVSVFFFFMHDYSLTFPADYFQMHNYMILIFSFLLFGSIYVKHGFEYRSLNKRNKIILFISLFYITMMLVIIPTSEKIFDWYQYKKANDTFAETFEGDIDAFITNSVSSCRENPPYQKTYLIFDCIMTDSKDYYVFAKNYTSVTEVITVTLDIYDENGKVAKTLESEEIILEPDEVGKLIFDAGIDNLPNWMQYSFQTAENVNKYQVKIFAK